MVVKLILHFQSRFAGSFTSRARFYRGEASAAAPSVNTSLSVPSAHFRLSADSRSTVAPSVPLTEAQSEELAKLLQQSLEQQKQLIGIFQVSTPKSLY